MTNSQLIKNIISLLFIFAVSTNLLAKDNSKKDFITNNPGFLSLAKDIVKCIDKKSPSCLESYLVSKVNTRFYDLKCETNSSEEYILPRSEFSKCALNDRDHTRLIRKCFSDMQKNFDLLYLADPKEPDIILDELTCRLSQTKEKTIDLSY